MSNVIKDLVDIGLTEYEAKVYSTLLNHDLLAAIDISRTGDVPRGRVYDIINQLILKGFCETVPGAVKKFRAVNPGVAVNTLIEHQKKQEERMLEVAGKLESMFSRKKSSSAPFDYIQLLTSKQSQINKFREMVEDAKEFIFSFTKKPYAVNPDLEDVKKVSAPFKKIIDSGVIVRTIYEADDSTENFGEWLGYFNSIGEQIRIAHSLPMKILIADKNRVMISLRNEGAQKFGLSSMVVEHSDLTTGLMELFEFYWNKSMTIEEYLDSRKLKSI
jgi:HTH-type transcriptional regulator, sugar sensing transcriptional regulator